MRDWLRTFWWWVLLAVLTVGGLGVSPTLQILLHHTAVHWLEEQGVVRPVIDEVRVRTLDGQLTVRDVHLFREGYGLLKVERLMVDLSWRDLLRRKIRLEALEIEGVQIEAGLDDRRWWIGGMSFPLAAAGEDVPPSKEEDSWAWGVERLLVNRADLQLDLAPASQRVGVGTLTFGPLDSDAPEAVTPMKGVLQWAGGRIDWQGRLRPLAAVPAVEGTLQMADLPLKEILPFLDPQQVRQLDGTLAGGLQLTVAWGEGPFRVDSRGSVRLKDLAWQAVGTRGTGKQVDWQGSASFNPGKAELWSVEGQLTGRRGQAYLEALDLEASWDRLQLKPHIRGESGGLTGDASLEGEKLRASIRRGPAGPAVAAVEDLTWDSAFTAHVGDAPVWHLSGPLKIGPLTVTDPQSRLRLGWAGAQLQPELGQERQRVIVSLQGGVNKLTTDVGAASLATVERVTVDGLQWEDGLRIAGLTLTETRIFADPPQPLAEVQLLQLTQLNQTDDATRLKRLAFSGGWLNLVRDKDGRLNLNRLLQRIPSGETPANQAAPSDTAAFVLGELVLEKGRFHWRDEAVAPPVSLAFEEMQARLEDVHSGQARKRSPFSFSARQGEYGRVTAAGELHPGSRDLNLDLEGSLKQVELLPLSPYIAAGIDQGVKHGQAGLDLKGSIADGQLDLTAKLHLARFELAPLEEGTAGLKTLSGLPLQKALDMLRDREGDVRLEIPVEGRLDDPQFGLQNVMTQALQKGIQQTALSYFAPIGIQLLTNVVLPPGSLFIAGKLVELAATVRFDPVDFTAGTAELSPAAAAQLKTLAETLKERPNIRLILAGYATTEEWPALVASRPEKDLSGVPPEQRKGHLLQLAKERAALVKRSLVDLGLDSQRIFPAAPQVDQQGQPRVELGA